MLALLQALAPGIVPVVVKYALIALCACVAVLIAPKADLKRLCVGILQVSQRASTSIKAAKASTPRAQSRRDSSPLTRGTQDPNTTSRVIPESGAITEYPEFERPDYSRHHNKQVRDLHSLWTLQVSLVHRRVRITYSPSRAPMRKHAPAVKTCPHSTRSLDPYSPARSDATS